ncbi:MAG: hypothetical protein HGA49_11450 [Eubacteriaceae bacterium]|nr:hypothetical protein [Eubacteriaceae bacterium]
MKITLLPKTRLGYWSAGLSILFIIMIWLKMQGLIPLMTFMIAGFGITGFFVGLIAVFMNKDWAILNFLSIIVGLLIILWIAAEIIFPH